MRKKNQKLSKAASSIEEVINRSHRGVQVDYQLPLQKKSNDPDILRELLAIERAIIEKARKYNII